MVGAQMVLHQEHLEASGCFLGTAPTQHHAVVAPPVGAFQERSLGWTTDGMDVRRVLLDAVEAYLAFIYGALELLVGLRHHASAEQARLRPGR